MEEEEPRRWRRVVYGGAQPCFGDNYTDSSFLEDMVMNASVVRRDLRATMLDSLVISQHLSLVAIVSSVWWMSLSSPSPSAALLLSLDAFFLCLGFFSWLLLRPISINPAIIVDDLRRCAIDLAFFVAALYSMTPIFHTLTRSISSDSIFASVACLLLLHLFLHDYSTGSAASPPQRRRSAAAAAASSSISINDSSRSVAANVSLHASIVASVLVASRLPSPPLVFATMLFSLEFFLLFPYLRNRVRCASLPLHVALSAAIAAAAALLLFLVAGALGIAALAAALSFVSLGCPLWLVAVHKDKFEIQGPWDEAKICFDIVD